MALSAGLVIVYLPLVALFHLCAFDVFYVVSLIRNLERFVMPFLQNKEIVQLSSVTGSEFGPDH